jgi:hypothetical protein
VFADSEGLTIILLCKGYSIFSSVYPGRPTSSAEYVIEDNVYDNDLWFLGEQYLGHVQAG